MSRFCVAVAVVVALVATSAAGPVDSCALQNDTAIGQFKLSTLDGLFGELLTTESYGNIYFVSICRPIPQSFYDPRKLAGAIKLTSDGHTIDLGRIDQTNVIVNEDTIVLTYVGGDRDTNSEDPCKGLRWKTYVIFSCDVTATNDVLTLVDEDPDQPDVCQVWFEIQTSKTCVRHPDLPLDILDADLSKHYKQVVNEKITGKTKGYLNNFSTHNKLSNNENSELNIHQNFSKGEAKHNNSPDSSYKDEPFININPNRIISTKILNNEKEETKFLQKHLHGISSKNESFVDKSPNHKINEKEENYFHPNHSYKNDSKKESIIYTSPHQITESKSINDEKIENDVRKRILEDKVYDKENNNNSSGSFEDKSFTNINPNKIKTKINYNEKEEKDFHQKYLHEISSKDTPFVNENLNHKINDKEENHFHPNHSYNNNSEEKPIIYTSPHQITESKSINDEKIENDVRKRILEDKVYDKENNNNSSGSFEDKSFTNINPNKIKTKINYNEKEEKDFHQKYLHEISSKDTPFVNENLNHKINDKEENHFHPNHSYNNNSEEKPIIYTSPHSITESKPINDEKIENDVRKRISENKVYDKENNNNSSGSFEDKSFINKNPNHKINEKEENYFHRNHLYKNNSKEEPFIYPNHIANKITNDENKEENSSQNAAAEKTSNIKNHEDRINNKFLNDEHSQNTYSENKYSKNQNNKLDNDFKREKYDLKNYVSSTNVPNTNNNEINYSGKNENIHIFKSRDNSTHEHRNSLPINNTKEVNESTNTEYINENVHKSIFKGTSHYHEKHGPVNRKGKDEENIIENRSSKNDADNFNESKEKIDRGNGSNTNHFPHQKVQNISENYNKGNSIDNHVIKSDLPNTHYNSESKPLHGRYNSIIENSTSDGHEFKDLNENYSTNTYFKPITDHNSNAIEDIKHRNNGSSHLIYDDYKNQSSEVENESVKKHFHGLYNYNRTNDEREFNGTFMNQKYTQNEHPDRSESELHGSPIDSSPSAHLSNIYDGDRLKAANTTGFFGGIYSEFQNLYSQLFPNGIQLSTATILGGLGSITAIFGLIGTATNHFYYKKTGTDQIPFKETFLCIYSYIKGFVTKIFFCCGRDSEEPESTNEKTPLLHPKNIMAPTVEDETLHKSGKYGKNNDDDRQQKSKNSGNDSNSEQNKEKQYGSLLNKPISQTSDKEYRKKKRKSKRSNTSSSDSGPENESWLYQDKEKLVKTERSLQDQLPKEEVINTKKSVKPSEQMITPIELVFEKMGKRVGSSDNEKKEKNIESIRNRTSFKPQDTQSSIQSNVIESHDSFAIAPSSKKDEIKNVSETKTEDDDDESVEVIEEIVYVEDGEEEGETIEEITETTTVEELPADQFDETDFEKSLSLTDSGARERPTMVTVRKSIRKISSSSSPGEVTTVEETFVSDNSKKNAKKGFGIKLGIGKSGVNMSVGEKKLGISKSGMKFGKRKEQEDTNEQEAMTIKLDKSGFKLHRKKNKSPLPTGSGEVGELDNQNLASPEKNKKSKSKSISKLFKRSISQPSVADISEIEDDPLPGGTIKRKFSTSSTNLFKFGKSRSKSTEYMKRTL